MASPLRPSSCKLGRLYPPATLECGYAKRDCRLRNDGIKSRTMDDDLRDYFDQQLEWVLRHLSAKFRELLDQVPLYVEDFPSKKMLRKLGVRHRHELQGLYSGVALTNRSVDLPPSLSEVIYLFREGICNLALDDEGQIDQDELREQIRITLLHELGHHFGLDERQLDELGYG